MEFELCFVHCINKIFKKVFTNIWSMILKPLTGNFDLKSASKTKIVSIQPDDVSCPLKEGVNEPTLTRFVEIQEVSVIGFPFPRNVTLMDVAGEAENSASVIEPSTPPHFSVGFPGHVILQAVERITSKMSTQFVRLMLVLRNDGSKLTVGIEFQTTKTIFASHKTDK